MIPCVFPYYGDVIFKEGKNLLKQDRVQTVPPVKQGEKEDIRLGGKRKLIRTMHQCEGSGYFGKGSPS